MRTPAISVDVSIDEFDDDEILEYLQEKGYSFAKEDEKPKINFKEFEFQKEAINDILTEAINKHGYNKVLEVLTKTSFKI